MERPTYETAMEWLAEQVPELRPAFDAHIADYDEVLPYVVFEGDYMQWFKENALRDVSSAAVSRFLECVELLFDGNDELANLAEIGFAENLVLGGPDESRVLGAVSPYVGPNTTQGLDSQRAIHERLGRLAKEYSKCRCKRLDSVTHEATTFYKRHMVWIDSLDMGLEIFRCPKTKRAWLLTPAWEEEQAQLVRFPDVDRARQAGLDELAGRT